MKAHSIGILLIGLLLTFVAGCRATHEIYVAEHVDSVFVAEERFFTMLRTMEANDIVAAHIRKQELQMILVHDVHFIKGIAQPKDWMLIVSGRSRGHDNMRFCRIEGESIAFKTAQMRSISKLTSLVAKYWSDFEVSHTDQISSALIALTEGVEFTFYRAPEDAFQDVSMHDDFEFLYFTLLANLNCY